MSLTTTGNGNSLVPQTMEQAIRLAEMMSKGRLMPAHLQDKPGDCLMVIELAMRFQMSPFAVAQCTSVIQGKMMLEGKLVAAALHSSGALKTRLDYAYEGEGDGRTVKVSATIAGETSPRSMVIRAKDVKTSNPLWTKQLDQQLAYSGARNWARRYAPEVMLGVYAPEEMEPSQIVEAFKGLEIAGHAEPATRDAINAETPPKPRTRADWLNELDADLRDCVTKDGVEARLGLHDVERALKEFTNGIKAKLDAVISLHRDRVSLGADAAFLPEGERMET